MSKFGDLISSSKFIFFNFYSNDSFEVFADSELKALAESFKNFGKVIKIDAERNKELVEMLQVKSYPTFMLYKDGLMVWRDNQNQKPNEIISSIQPYLKE